LTASQRVELLDDPTQRTPLAERVAAAEGLGADDPRLDRPALAIPAGSFWCGTEEPAGHYSEWPRRRLTLQTFAIDPYPTTVLQFGRFIADGGYRASGASPTGRPTSPPTVRWSA
jgi:formylglycine-generating enzyme required for sulfatase activity